MRSACLFFKLLLVISIKFINCDLDLRIFRNIDENYSLVTSVVEEHAGNNLTLSCELFNNSEYDDHIIWGKSTKQFRFETRNDLNKLITRKSIFSQNLMQQNDINRAQLLFTPLKPSDAGLYFCWCQKFNLFQIIDIVVINNTEQWVSDRNFTFNSLDVECGEKKFRCKSNNICIPVHYACDKKVDCLDGSDEAIETCNGDPCKDKFMCKDRCIPTYWCCNKHSDPNCNVTYRHECCSFLDSIEEFELTQVKTGGRTHYIFISLCILATFFSIILMLLILSKVFLFAKKTSQVCARHHTARRGNHFQQLQLDEISVPCSYHTRNIITRYNADCFNSNGTSDLLILSDDIIRFGDSTDRPPSYTDVMGQLDPPPPYTSRDCLNQS